MDFEGLFNKLEVKANDLEVAMSILPQKNKILHENMILMDQDVKEIKKLELMIKDLFNERNSELKEEYAEVKEIVENVNLKMLFLLSEIEKIESVKQQSQPQNVFSEKNIKNDFSSLYNEFNTPRMSIDQYAKSPFTKNKKSTKLQFSDFEAEITNEQFEKIPSYIKGRIVLSELSEFLENIVIKSFNFKYELFYKNRAALKPSDYNLQLLYKEQSAYFEGHKFITMGDIARIIGKNVDKKDEKFLQCLRFLHIIKEARKNSATCYIWIEK